LQMPRMCICTVQPDWARCAGDPFSWSGGVDRMGRSLGRAPGGAVSPWWAGPVAVRLPVLPGPMAARRSGRLPIGAVSIGWVLSQPRCGPAAIRTEVRGQVLQDLAAIGTSPHGRGRSRSAEEFAQDCCRPEGNRFIGVEVGADLQGRIGGFHSDDVSEPTEVVDVTCPGRECLHREDVIG